MLETGNGSVFRSPGHGTWQHVGGRDFTATLIFFRFDPNSTTHAFIGTAQAIKTIAVGDDDNEFTASASVEFFDALGNFTGKVCTSETAQRLE